jgi:carboxyl-terminal processing protease
MKKWITIICLAICVLSPIHIAASAETGTPYAEITEVFNRLRENHINKPSESQLVQGALKLVSEQINKYGNGKITPASEDDTLAELLMRIAEWESLYRVEAKKLNRLAIEGMLATLNDPHTMYFSREELKRFQESVDNEYVGFGFRLRLQDKKLVIREVIPNSPASRAGLRPGDLLLNVDGISLTGKTFEEAYSLLKGEEDSVSMLTIFRPSANQTKQFRLKRAVLTIPEVVGMPFDGGIGYIRLETFGSDSAQEFYNQLKMFTQGKQSMKGLVVDLRDNSGGYLSAARDIASLFMEEGLLMYMVDRNGVEIPTWVHNGQDIGIPVRILVNEGSASASELLSGALRDHGIAKLVGTKTFGKGSAQQLVPLDEGAALKITLHEYFTPNHTVVNHVGITPDIVVKDDIAQVIETLRSLGVKHFVLRESGDEVTVNGVDFRVTAPLFTLDKQGVGVRSGVLGSLLQDSSFGETGYTPIQSIGKRAKDLVVHRQGVETVLTFTMK